MKFAANLSGIVVALSLFFAPVSIADVIVFKTGKELKAEKIWEQGDQIFFYYHGLKAGIPKRRILRVKSGSDESAPTIEPEADTNPELTSADSDRSKGAAQPTDHSVAAVASNEGCDNLRVDGFCDLQWGRRAASVAGLEKRQVISELDGVVEYVRSADILKLGDICLESITYAFWRDQLYTVTIWARGYSDFTALRDKAFEAFGPGRRIDSARERYLWSDTVSDALLEYIEDGSYGMLWLRSKELDRQCQQARLKTPISYLRWLKAGK